MGRRSLLRNVVTNHAATSAASRATKAPTDAASVAEDAAQWSPAQRDHLQRAISACEKCREPQHALHRLQQSQLRSLRPDAITYNVAISAREKGQQPLHALHTSQKLQLRGLRPGAITYNAALSACETGHKQGHHMRCISRRIGRS